MPEVVKENLHYIVIFNSFLVGILLVLVGKLLVVGELSEIPGSRQNLAEYALEWFYKQAKQMRPEKVNNIVPFLASFFFFILGCNLLAILPFPIVKIPPTSYYSVTLSLALSAILGIIFLNAKFNGVIKTVKHLFWPNPIQLVSELSDVLSLSLRLFGNIGGEFIVALLVVEAAPYGVPLVIHALGLIPAVVQPLVFTLLTSNFLASAIVHKPHKEEGKKTSLGETEKTQAMLNLENKEKIIEQK